MSALLDKMNQQFTDMHKLAQDFSVMAEQAIIERDKARDALRECAEVLEIMADWIGCYGAVNDPNNYELLPRSRAAIQSATNALEGK